MDIRGKLRESIGMPPLLLIVEVFMAISVLRNLNMFGIASFYLVDTDDPDMIIRYGSMIVISVTTSVLAVKTMFGIPSRNRYSWRSTVRTTIFLVLSSIFYEVNGVTYMNLTTIEQILILAAVSMAVLMLPSTRAHFVPPMYEVPRLGWWLRLCLLRPNDRHHRYEFSEKMEESANGIVPAEVNETDTCRSS